MASEPQMKELHDEMLVLLKWFHEFCMEHDIKYSLHGGTLLGAIREGGFIPWDDDMDVILTRDQFDRLLSALRSGPVDGGISLQRFDKAHRLVMLRQNRELVWIDLLVYDYISGSRPAQICKIGGAMFLAGLMKTKDTLKITRLKGRRGWKYCAFYTAYLLGRPFPLSWKFRAYDWFTKNCFCGKRQYFHLSNDQYSGVKLILPANIMDSYVLVPYEDTQLMVTAAYRFMLSTIYGSDYMTPKKYPDREFAAHSAMRDVLEKHMAAK